MSDQATTTISASDMTTTTTVTAAAAADLETTTTVTVPSPPVKPGWRTTEFWFKLGAIALSSVFASGVLTSDRALAIAGIAATVLTALGYTVSRTVIKTAGVLLLLIALGPLLVSCSSGTAAAKAVGQVAWDCTAPQRAESVAVLTPLATSAIRAAASADGKLLDASMLKAALGTANLKTNLGAILVCAAAEAFATLVHAPKPASSGSAPFEIEPIAAQAAFNQLRAEQFPGVQITTEHGAI